MTNAEAFQLEAAVLLAAGYKNFPESFNWECDADNELYPTEQGSSREQIQSNTIRWLDDYGYLTNEGLSGCWMGLRLTEKGLMALNAVPDVLSGKEPLGKRLVAAIGSGSIDVVKQLIPLLLQQGISGA